MTLNDWITGCTAVAVGVDLLTRCWLWRKGTRLIVPERPPNIHTSSQQPDVDDLSGDFEPSSGIPYRRCHRRFTYIALIEDQLGWALRCKRCGTVKLYANRLGVAHDAHHDAFIHAHENHQEGL